MINVDDLGLSAAVNEAVITLAQMQRIQATSFMSHGAIASDAINELHRLNIDIGLHLDLTGFHSVASLKTILIYSYCHRLSETFIINLINQQLDRFEDIIGRKPVFIDGHQHVHQFPQIRNNLVAIIQQRYGNSVGIRSTKPIQTDLKAHLIYHLGGKQLDKILQKKGIVHNCAFAGVYNFNADAKNLAHKWEEWFEATPADGAIIMCHPAVPSTSWHDEIKKAREIEWQWLCSDAFMQCWQQKQCYSIKWKNLVSKF